MLHRPRERVLLWAVALLAILGIADWARARLQDWYSDLDRKIAERSAELAAFDAGRARQGQIQTLLRKVERQIDLPLAERQTMFRRYLEETVRPLGVMESVTPLPPSDLTAAPDLRVLSFDLRVRMSLENLVSMLAALDRSEQPLAVTRVRVTPLDPDTRTLLLETTISTLVKRRDATP